MSITSSYKLHIGELKKTMMTTVTKILWTLRSSTATSTETSPQNVALLYRKSFAILSSRSCCFMWPKYSKNKLARSGFRIQMEKKSLHLYAQVVVKISNLVISRHCYAKYRKN